MRIVIDTNIFFSALLDTNSKIGMLLFQPKSRLNFYSSKLLLDEINEHKHKILKIANYSESDLNNLVRLLSTKIRFINIELIPIKILEKAEKLASDVDIDDTEFVALAEHINGKLWTGDKKLSKGLLEKGWGKIITTDELFKLSVQK